MKVEFIVNADINDGRQIFIQESEFKKAKSDEEEVQTKKIIGEENEKGIPIKTSIRRQ
jgi:hypothetical protein